jgi:hypothetical protein
MNKPHFFSLAVAACLAVANAPALAQSARFAFDFSDLEHSMSRLHEGLAPLSQLAQFDMFSFSSGVPTEGRNVTGKPFAAEAINESTQLLADGTRISSTSTVRLARDNDGRFRHESTNAAGKKRVWIQDPVAKRSIVLDPEAKTATVTERTHFSVGDMNKMMPNLEGVASKAKEAARAGREAGNSANAIGEAVRKALKDAGLPTDQGTVVVSPEGKSIANRSVQIVARDGTGPRGFNHWHSFSDLGPDFPTTTKSARNTQTESLGTKLIEGTNAEGTRRTTTIAAGEIGNDRPIVSTTETWKSLDLGMTLSRRTNDPRKGETTYRLQNLSRENPPLSLFTVPEGYKLIEGSARSMQMFRS